MRGYSLCVVVLLCCMKACTEEIGAVENNSTLLAAAAATTVTESVAASVSNATSTTTRRPLLQDVRLPCSCVDGQCGCCTGLVLERFRQKACMNFTYDPDEFAITASVSMNQRVLYKNTVSGKNPPPMCINVPRFRFIRFCVEFSNIYFARRNIHMCINAEANWQDFTLVEWSFDCVRLGASGVAVIGPEDGGGLALSPFDQEDQDDEDYDDSARNVPHYGTVMNRTLPIRTKKLENGDVEFLLDSDFVFEKV